MAERVDLEEREGGKEGEVEGRGGALRMCCVREEKNI